MNVLPLYGPPLEKRGETYVFKGKILPPDGDGQVTESQGQAGLYLFDKIFSGGRISATFSHATVDEFSASEIVISHSPDKYTNLNVGIPRDRSALVGIRKWENGKWSLISIAGDRGSLTSATEYKILAEVSGSSVSVHCNGIEMIRTTLPTPFTSSQFGVFFVGTGEITVKDIVIENVKPTAFVVMQFSSPYNEVYADVIRDVCKSLDVEVMRIDESTGPGLIISEITQAIKSSTFVIADVSPVNANVFYEVGYAHGINKPTILMAEKGTKLPFDVSPFRTLFYDNSISGKSRLEVGLAKFINSILGTK